MGKYSSYVSCVLLLALTLCASRPIRSCWVSGGVLLSAGSNNRSPKIVKDGTSGAIIAWCNDTQIYAQRIDISGTCKWTGGGVLISSSGTDPQIVSDGAGGAIIVWQDNRNGNPDIYAQKVDSLGSILWTGGGIAVCTAMETQKSFRMVTDCSGGAIIAWEDERDDNTHAYAQKIDTYGNAQWVADGAMIDAGVGNVYGPDIASDDSGGAYITWATVDTATTELLERRVLLAKVNSDGYHSWNTLEIVCDNWTAFWPGIEWSFPRITRDGYGAAIVSWPTCSVDLLPSLISAQKVNAPGQVCWEEGVVIGTMLPHEIQLKPDGLGGAVIVWFCIDDVWTAVYDIVAGRIDSGGSVAWTDRVFFSFNAPDYALAARNYHLNDNGCGGFQVAWDRGLYLDEEGLWRYDIYSKRLNNEGVVWLGNGVPVCTVAGDQSNPQVISTADGKSITAWEDPRGDGSIYAQLLNDLGELPTATLLQCHSSSFDGEKVVIEWTLSEESEEMQFFILRAEGDGGSFQEIQNPTIVQTNMTYTFTDWNCDPCVVYQYRVEVEDEMSRRLLFESDPVNVPSMPLTFHQNFPNPFNPHTTIRYYLPESGPVVLEVYDVAGRKVIGLVNDHKTKGRHEIEWDGRDANSNSVASGIYYCLLRADKKSISKKLVVIR